MIDALCEDGVAEIFITNRSIDKAQESAEHFAKYWPNVTLSAHPMSDISALVNQSNLIINSTSLGMVGQPELEIDLTHAPKDTIAYDLVYSPLETDFLAQARKLDLKCVDGLGMLLHQGRPGFEIWFGKMPDATLALRDIMLSAK